MVNENSQVENPQVENPQVESNVGNNYITCLNKEGIIADDVWGVKSLSECESLAKSESASWYALNDYTSYNEGKLDNLGQAGGFCSIVDFSYDLDMADIETSDKCILLNDRMYGDGQSSAVYSVDGSSW